MGCGRLPAPWLYILPYLCNHVWFVSLSWLGNYNIYNYISALASACSPYFFHCPLYVSSWFTIMPAPRRSSFFFQRPLYKNLVISENRDFRVLFSSSMLKRSVGYENLHSNSPLRDKQTLKISWKSTGYFSHNKLFVNWPIKVIIVNISNTIKDIIKIQTSYKTWGHGACIKLSKIIFCWFLN